MPVLLVLNIFDEAENLGIDINMDKLSKELNIPVIKTVGTTGSGMDILRGKIEEHVKRFC